MTAVGEKNVLLLETAECSVEGAGQILSQCGFHVQAADSSAQALESIRAGKFGLVVGRLCHCSRQPLALLNSLRGLAYAPPVLVVIGGADQTLYLEAMQRGAFDCIALPLNSQELMRIVSRALGPQPELCASAGGE